MSLNHQQPIAVVGGGMTGIAAALELAKSSRFKITLFEKNSHLGGLSDYYSWNGITWDRFYHVVLSTDSVLLGLIGEIGLKDQLFWRETQSGFYGDGRLVSMSTPRDFICFPFLSFWQKCRLAMGILYSTKLNNVTKLDRIYARQWLTKVFGRRVYEKIWDPLLRSKLGSARDKTSAAFIWATIKRLYGARSAENKQEKMGHVHGGYQTILHAAAKRLKELGVIIKTDTPIINVQSTQHMRQTQSTSRTNQTKPTNQSTQAVQVETPNNQFEFDKVLLTTDCPTVLRMLGGRLNHLYWERLSEIEYLGVISLMLILDRSLSPYYVINLLDQTMPFTGIIESTNVVDPRELQSRHIVFLPKYITADDPAHQMADDQVIELFFGNLQRVFPDLNHSNVLHAKVFREKFVQPLQTLYHLEQTVGIQTPIDHIYLANTAMIQNSTLNNNAAVALGKKAAGVMLDSE